MTRFITRLIPYPLLALALFLMWMALAEAYSPGQFVLATVIALGAVWAVSALKLDKPRIRRPLAALRLFFYVSIDIIRSNIAVASIIMRRQRSQTSGFLSMKLDLRDPSGLAVLACVLTATPGTIWVSYTRADGQLLLHVLDLVDEETWIDLIKNRYERLLMEIFE